MTQRTTQADAAALMGRPFETLDPRSGVSSAKQETPLTGMHMPSLYQPLWSDNMVYLKLDSQLYAVDLATGKPAFQL